MDEAGRTTQPPLIMAPPGLDVEPDREAAGAATPLPADTVGQAKNGQAKNGSAVPVATRAAAEVKPAETKAEPAVKSTPNGSSDRAPSFTPAAEPASPAPATSPAPAWTGPAYQAPTPTPVAAPDYSRPDYSRPDWQEQPASAQPATAQPTTAQPTAGANGATAPAGPAGPADTAVGGLSSVSNFSSAAATAVTGTASGLVSSVTSAWRKRGGSAEDRRPRVQAGRKATKRQAMLTLARVEPWSVMKFSFVASVVAFIILFVAVAVLYMVLSALGVFDSIQNTVNSLTSSKDAAGTNISHWFSASLILGYTAMLGALNIVLITAISTIGSVIYNLIAKTIGGIEVTLRETD